MVDLGLFCIWLIWHVVDLVSGLVPQRAIVRMFLWSSRRVTIIYVCSKIHSVRSERTSKLSAGDVF